MRTHLLLFLFFISPLAGITQTASAEDKRVAIDDVVDQAAEWAEQAEGLFAHKKYSEAERTWRMIVEKYPASPQFGVAQFNVGYSLQAQEKYDSAILEYQKILPSKVNDKDPGSNIMEAYRNYRNRAAKQISTCYEKVGLNRQALDWAVQARDKYRYQTWCGTCADQESAAAAKNIARLQRIVDGEVKR